jgi:Ca2+/H+ antiporter, TMEM165/GDT1 family
MNWDTLLSTFGLVFVAELGDKTQLAVVTQVCKHRRPWAVFGGASLALILVTALGAVGGQLLRQFVPQHILPIIAGAAFLVMGLLIGIEAYKTTRNEALCKDCENTPAECEPGTAWPWRAFGATFALLFIAELGDKTQLAVLGLSGKAQMPQEVFIGGALALTSVTALGVLGGEGLCKLVPERTLLWISAIAFVILGILMILGIF